MVVDSCLIKGLYSPFLYSKILRQFSPHGLHLDIDSRFEKYFLLISLEVVYFLFGGM